jgi:predicted RNase H-like HicB family nuclease
MLHAEMRAMRRLTAAITHEPPWYVARCLEVEVASQGGTIEEALSNLREALDLYFEDEPPGEPLQNPIIAPIELTA